MENKSIIDDSRITSPIEAYENLLCFVCLAVCDQPLLLNCCEGIICTKCISDWTSKNNSCPKCRNEKPQTEVPNKFIMRLFSNLRVKCVFEDKGCKDIVSFDTINDHEKNCIYNHDRIVKCKKCFLEIPFKLNESHNCINDLLLTVNNLTKKLDEFSIKEQLTTSGNCKTELGSCAFVQLQVPIDKKDLIIDIISNFRIHNQHPLVKTTRKAYICDMCRHRYENFQSFYCSICDFDLCSNCYNFANSKVEDNR